VIQGSNLRAKFAAGEMPQDLDELEGAEMEIGGKPDGFPVTDDDVLYWNWLAPGGYGDPLTRDPDKVMDDLRSGAITPRDVDEVYGMRLGHDGEELDREGTAKRRERKLLERLHDCGVERDALAPTVEPAAGAESIGDAYLVDREAGAFRCHRCATDLGPLDGNPKLAMASRERPTTALDPSYPELPRFVDDEVVFREFCCPGCGVRLATETGYPGEAPFHELRLA
jgi:N-methylhydantoinase B